MFWRALATGYGKAFAKACARHPSWTPAPRPAHVDREWGIRCGVIPHLDLRVDILASFFLM